MEEEEEEDEDEDVDWLQFNEVGLVVRLEVDDDDPLESSK